MFVVEYSFEFTGNEPSVEAIKDNIETRTGMSLSHDNTISLSYIADKNNYIYFEHWFPEANSDNIILNLLSHNPNMTYLIGNGILSILELGGKMTSDYIGENAEPANHTKDIPDWAYLPYEEAKKHPDFIP